MVADPALDWARSRPKRSRVEGNLRNWSWPKLAEALYASSLDGVRTTDLAKRYGLSRPYATNLIAICAGLDQGLWRLVVADAGRGGTPKQNDLIRLVRLPVQDQLAAWNDLMRRSSLKVRAESSVVVGMNLPREEYARLKVRAAARGMTMAALCREYVRMASEADDEVEADVVSQKQGRSK